MKIKKKKREKMKWHTRMETNTKKKGIWKELKKQRNQNNVDSKKEKEKETLKLKEKKKQKCTEKERPHRNMKQYAKKRGGMKKKREKRRKKRTKAESKAKWKKREEEKGNTQDESLQNASTFTLHATVWQATKIMEVYSCQRARTLLPLLFLPAARLHISPPPPNTATLPYTPCLRKVGEQTPSPFSMFKRMLLSNP